jgi:hypothetical protein
LQLTRQLALAVQSAWECGGGAQLVECIGRQQEDFGRMFLEVVEVDICLLVKLCLRAKLPLSSASNNA